MTALPDGSTAPDSDSALLARVRAGDRNAYGVLWDRHHGAGLAAARAVTAAFDPEDLVSEAFVRVLKAIENGNGPEAAFRPYLVTTVRSVAARWGAQPAELTPEELEVVDPATSDEAFSDRFDRSLTVQAFNTLPQRWQEVLWYTEAEQLPPREVAALVGIKANAVSALAKRARQGLRHAWVQAHVASVPEGSECRWAVDRLAVQTRTSLPAREQDRLDAHLDECDRCPLAAEEMAAASRRLGALILIGFLGAGAATAYSAVLKPAAATAATVGAGKVGVVAWLAKPGWARNASIGASATVAAGAIAVGVAFAATGAGHDATKVAEVAAPASGAAAAAPSSAAPPAAPSAPSAAPGATAPPPKSIASAPENDPAAVPPASVAAPAAASRPAHRSPATRPASTPTPAPLTVSVDTGPDNEYYPVVSGTGAPGATITITDGGGTLDIETVSSGGTYSTPQLTAVAAGTTQLTVAEKSTSGASASDPVNVTVASAPTVTLDALASTAEVSGVSGAGVEITTDDGTVITGKTTDTDISVPLATVSVTGRYENGAGTRYGPSGSSGLLGTGL